MPKILEIISGTVYGKLTSIKESEFRVSRSGRRERMVLCKCVCGSVRPYRLSSLRRGTATSCGCIPAAHIHGLSKHPLYSIWSSMRQRCDNRRNKSYPYYGGNGITVCKAWDTDFKSFYAWAMNNGYSEGLQIDRIDNDYNYSPSNCRWVSATINNRNRSTTIVITYQDITATLWEHCHRLGVDYKKTHARIYTYGWEPERAFTE